MFVYKKSRAKNPIDKKRFIITFDFAIEKSICNQILQLTHRKKGTPRVRIKKFIERIVKELIDRYVDGYASESEIYYAIQDNGCEIIRREDSDDDEYYDDEDDN